MTILRQLVQQVSHINLLSKDWYLTETWARTSFYVSDNPVGAGEPQ
nr:hypothetical protein [Escherichia coli O25b:H4-ST131]